jgi:hypothetical protein
VAKLTTIANQVFVGIPWRNVRSKYEHAIDWLLIRSPLSFVIVGRGDNQDAQDLLDVIKGKLESSSYAVFDATAGNANVSLEYGYAEAKNIPRALYLSGHKAAHKNKDLSIISDLAGKRRNQYSNESRLRSLLLDFSKKHPYSVRFEKFLSQETRRLSKGAKKRIRALALKIVHVLDGQSDVRRDDLVEKLRADVSGYTGTEIDNTVKRLHRNGLLYVERGRYSRVYVA